jgi:hypothetical protein
MSRRIKNYVEPHNDPFALEREWLWFFSGIHGGFPREDWYEKTIPEERRSEPHPLLMDELRNTPRVVVVPTKNAGGYLPQRKLWLKLLQARTPQDTKNACKESLFWIREDGTVKDSRILYFLSLLCDLASVFLVAKKEKRYPQSDRPSSDAKRVLYLARAMAGACLGVTPRYANEELFRNSKAAESEK